jgi:hypothetical protein
MGSPAGRHVGRLGGKTTGTKAFSGDERLSPHLTIPVSVSIL